MVGYMGDARAEKAHIIIRRRQLDSASNDIGFARDGNGVYQALISEYDRGIGFNHAWLGRLAQTYVARNEPKAATLEDIHYSWFWHRKERALGITLDGKVLWQLGRPDPRNGLLTNDTPFQIHDIDGDGKNEVILVRDFPAADTRRQFGKSPSADLDAGVRGG